MRCRCEQLDPLVFRPWIGGWQPVAGSELLYPPPGIGSAQVLPGIIAGNPEEVRTLPWLFVTTYPGALEYAHVPLAHRVDIDRLYGLMKMSPEWSDVVCHGRDVGGGGHTLQMLIYTPPPSGSGPANSRPGNIESIL